MKITLNLIATNKYLTFLEIICPTINDFFFPDEEIIVIVHTNLDLPENLKNYGRISFVKNHIEHEPWPSTTLKRFEYFLISRDCILQSDFSFYIDVDSVFIKKITNDILINRGMIGTIHPCLSNGPGTPERNHNSRAFISPDSINRYFCGGFFGGTSREFIDAAEVISTWIKDDLSRNVMAIWHDESHLNKYFFVNPPMLVLDVPFAVAENLTPQHENSRIKFLDKNKIGGHDYFRS
jgi:hypothetical protein